MAIRWPWSRSEEEKATDLLKKEFDWDRVVRIFLNDEQAFLRKETYLNSLENNRSARTQYIDVLNKQMRVLRRTFRFTRRRQVKLSLDIKRTLVAQDTRATARAELNQEILDMAGSRVQALSDQQAIELYKKLFEATLEHAEIAHRKSGLQDDVITIEKQYLDLFDHLMINLQTQKAIVGLGEKRTEKMSEIVFNGKNSYQELLRLVNEEKRFFGLLLKDQRELHAIENRMIDLFAKDVYRPEAIRLQVLKLIRDGLIGASTGFLLFVLTSYVDEMIRKLSSPFAVHSEMVAQIKRDLEGKTFEQILATIPDEKMKEIYEATKQANRSRFIEFLDRAVVEWQNQVYDELIAQTRARIALEPNARDLEVIVHNMQANQGKIKDAIRAVLSTYKIELVKKYDEFTVKDAKARESMTGLQKFREFLEKGGLSPQITGQLEQQIRRTLIYDMGLDRVAAAIKNTAVKVVEVAIKETVKAIVPKVVRDTVSFIAQNWAALGLLGGGLGIAWRTYRGINPRVPRPIRSTIRRSMKPQRRR